MAMSPSAAIVLCLHSVAHAEKSPVTIPHCLGRPTINSLRPSISTSIMAL